MEKRRRKRHTIDEGIVFYLYGMCFNGHKITIRRAGAKKFRLPRKLKKGNMEAPFPIHTKFRAY